MNKTFPCLVAAALSIASLCAQEWTRFRGPNGSGVTNTRIPESWDKYEWQTALPGQGHSSPVLWGDRLFVTGTPDDASRQEIYCLDANSGDLLWTQTFPGKLFEKHRYNSYASPTPVVDADRVYLSWSVPDDYQVIALNHQGETLWQKHLGPFQSMHGGGASPILYQDLLILCNDQQGESFTTALNRTDGANVWRTPRPSGMAAYATPCLLQQGDQDSLIFISKAAGIVAADPATGKDRWSFPSAFDKRAVSSPFLGGDLVFGSCGSGGGGNYLVAIQPPASPGEPPVKKYELRRAAPYVPTGIAHNGLVFTWSDSGIVSCLRLATGEVLWQERVGGRYFASPILAGNLLLNISDQGDAPILRAAEKFEVVSRNTFPEGSHATPAVANGRLYVRTFGQVFCIKGL